MLDGLEADLMSLESNSGPKGTLSSPDVSAPSTLGKDGRCTICECLQRAPISGVQSTDKVLLVQISTAAQKPSGGTGYS